MTGSDLVIVWSIALICATVMTIAVCVTVYNMKIDAACIERGGQLQGNQCLR